MIPLRVSVDRPEAVPVVIALIIAITAVFLLQSALPPELAEMFLYQMSLVPARYTRPDAAAELDLDPDNFLPFVTNTFLHAGPLHLIVNMWTLWIFGRPLEQRLGPVRFLFVYLASGFAASLTHFAANLDSAVPALGASGAVAGVVGCFTLVYPRARVVLITPISIFPVVYTLPAATYSAVWFVFQLVPGLIELFGPESAGGIAWWAHLGGFATGLAIAQFGGVQLRRVRDVGPVHLGARAIGPLHPGRRVAAFSGTRTRKFGLARVLAAPSSGRSQIRRAGPRPVRPAPTRMARPEPTAHTEARGTPSEEMTGNQQQYAATRSVIPESGQFPETPRSVTTAADVLLVSCVDNRITGSTMRYMESRGLSGEFLHIALPGASLGILTGEHPVWGEAFWDQLDLLLEAGRLNRIIVVDHRDCVAYKQIFGTDFAEDPDYETATHAEQLVDLRRSIHAQHPELDVETFLMALDGTVERVT